MRTNDGDPFHKWTNDVEEYKQKFHNEIWNPRAKLQNSNENWPFGIPFETLFFRLFKLFFFLHVFSNSVSE